MHYTQFFKIRNSFLKGGLTIAFVVLASKNMNNNKLNTTIQHTRPNPAAIFLTEIPEKVRLGSNISALNTKTQTNNPIKQTRSNSRSTIIVENAPEKVMPFFFPTR